MTSTIPDGFHAMEGESLEIGRCSWRGFAAWRLRGKRIEAVVSSMGAQIACLRSCDDDLNPLWQPPWPSCHPEIATSSNAWGAWPKAPINAVMVGSFPCIDVFGLPPPGDVRPMHGEACCSPWRIHQQSAGLLSLDIHLPRSQMLVRRTFSIRDEELVLTTSFSPSRRGIHRLIYCEHTMIGDPFLSDAVFSSEGACRRTESARDMTGGAFRAHPPASPPLSRIVSFPVSLGRWQASNPILRRSLSVNWDHCDLPWLIAWSESRSVAAPPWSRQGRVQGMELSTISHPGPSPRQGSTISVEAGQTRSIAIGFRWSRYAG